MYYHRHIVFVYLCIIFLNATCIYKNYVFSQFYQNVNDFSTNFKKRIGIIGHLNKFHLEMTYAKFC